MSDDGELDDDNDTQWRPRPDRELEERSHVEERSGVEERAVGAPPPGHPPVERIVLSDEVSDSVWARHAAGDGPRVLDDHNREDDPLDDASPSEAERVLSSAVGVTASGDAPTVGTGSTSVRRRSVVRVAAGALAVLVVIAVSSVVVLRGGESALSTSSAPELPAGAEIVWTSRVAGAVEATAVGEGLVVVASADGVTALSETDGELVWRREHTADDGDIRRVAVMGERVVVTQQRQTGTTEVRSFDGGTGTEIWRTGGDDGTYSISGPIDDPVIVGRARMAGGTVLTLLDPVDGSTLGDPVRLSSVEATGDDFGVVPSDGRVAVWSTDEGDIVAGPVDAFNMRTVAELDRSVVALDLEGRIVAFDEDGRRSDELLLVGDGSGDDAAAIAQVDLVGTTSAAPIGIVSGESSLGFTVVDGGIETVWQRAGRVTPSVATLLGDLSVLITPGESGGAVGEVVIDSADGSTVTVIDVPGPRERISTLGSNGYLVAPALAASERVVSAVGYDGEALWSLTLTPDADYDLVGGVVLIVEPTPGGGAVSVAR